MPMHSNIQRDVRAVREELENLRRAIDAKRSDPFLTEFEFSDELAKTEIERFPQRMHDHIDAAEAALGDLEQNVEDEYLALHIPLAVRAIELEAEAVASATEHEIDNLSSNAISRSGSAQRFANWIKRVLIPALKKIMGKAWQILSKLMTPKSWKLKGKVGNDFLGLASAEIEINFGG